MELILSLVLFAGASVVYGLSLIIYRLFFHPLASFPGPKIVAATRWWEFYTDVVRDGGGKFAFEVELMHRKYGMIIRVSPDELHVKDPEWLDVLYNAPGKIRDKYAPAAHMVGTPLGSFGTVSHEIHRRRRGANSVFFSTRSLVLCGPVFRKNVELLCERLRSYKNKKQAVNIRVEYLAYSTECVCNSAFRTSLGMLQLDAYEKSKNWTKTMDAVGNITPLAKQFPWIVPMALNLPISVIQVLNTDLAHLVELHKDMHIRAEKAIVQNEREGSDLDPESTPIVFESILSSKLPLKEKDRDRMGQEAFDVITAGSDTISRVLSIATFHLLDNPESLLRLREELIMAMPNAYIHIEVATLKNLPWLTAVVKESLRITALVTSRLPVVHPYDSLCYQDWKIPAGTPISMTLSNILMDPNAYSNPYKFSPERWLEDNPEAERAHRFFVPFNRGGRSCLGIDFAYAELYIVLATVFRRFELELYETNRKRDVEYSHDYFLGNPAAESLGIRVKIVGELK